MLMASFDLWADSGEGQWEVGSLMMMAMMVIMLLMVMTIVLLNNGDDDGNDDYNSDDDGDNNNSDCRPVWTIVDDKEMITTGNN